MLIDFDLNLSIDKFSDISNQEKALVEAFSCGKNHIDNYLKNDALDDINHGITKTFLIFSEIKDNDTSEVTKDLLAYFTLTADRVLVTSRSKVNLTLKEIDNYIDRQRIPGIQIHHYAVDKRYQNKGFGRELMYTIFAFIKSTILPYVGSCLITLHSELDVVNFYQKVGFEKTGEDSSRHCNMAFITKYLYLDSDA